jgi:hypothetical protein
MVAFVKQTVDLHSEPVVTQQRVVKGVTYSAVIGGRPGSRLIQGRQPVTKFVQDAGAVAGINGAFFVMTAIKSNDSRMIGPVVSETGSHVVPFLARPHMERLEGRPLVLWNAKSIAFIPYQWTMNSAQALEGELPEVSGGFVGGAWLVVDGRPLTREEIRAHGPKDADTPRRRAAFGVTKSGAVCLLAASGSVPSSRLGEAAAEFGCSYAVLLDSGFSTSLVYGGRTLVSGDSTSKTPSRPVPHAIVLYGPTVR